VKIMQITRRFANSGGFLRRGMMRRNKDRNRTTFS